MNTSCRHNCTGTVCVVLHGESFQLQFTRLVHVSPLAHLAPVDWLALLIAPLRLGATVAALLPRHLSALRGDDLCALPPALLAAVHARLRPTLLADIALPPRRRRGAQRRALLPLHLSAVFL